MLPVPTAGTFGVSLLRPLTHQARLLAVAECTRQKLCPSAIAVLQGICPRVLALEWVFRAIVIGEVGLDMTPCFVHAGNGFCPSAGRAGKSCELRVFPKNEFSDRRCHADSLPQARSDCQSLGHYPIFDKGLILKALGEKQA